MTVMRSSVSCFIFSFCCMASGISSVSWSGVSSVTRTGAASVSTAIGSVLVTHHHFSSNFRLFFNSHTVETKF